MSTRHTATIREIDLTVARTLKKVRELEARVATQRITVRAYPRTRVPGPLTYARMSTGQLAMAALAGAAIYQWSQQEQDFFEGGLESRGFDQALSAWKGNDPVSEIEGEKALDTPRFDQLASQLTLLTSNGLDNLAGAVDEVILGGDGRVPTALSPAEVTEDLHLAGMDDEAIAAFEEGVGTSTVSPSEEIDSQTDGNTQQEETSLTYEQTNEQGLTL